MADFCHQCSIELFGKDFRELADLVKYEYKTAQVLCEGCGPTIVDKNGVCINKDCLRKHGLFESGVSR